MKRWLKALWAKASRVLAAANRLVPSRMLSSLYGGVANRVIAIIIGVMIVGAIGGTAFAFGVANFSSADSSVATVLGVFVPIIAAIAIALAFLGRRA